MAQCRCKVQFDVLYVTHGSDCYQSHHLRPCHSRRAIIRGMRIRVSDILGYLAAGDSRETLLDQFPDLEDEDITAALEYAQQATDHRLIAAE
jgi:uncharacterized protein (DUF433 family)